MENMIVLTKSQHERMIKSYDKALEEISRLKELINKIGVPTTKQEVSP